MCLELQRARMHLHRGRAVRFRCEHRAERRERRSSLRKRKLAPREAQERLGRRCAVRGRPRL